MDIFHISLSDIQPSQLYLCREKLIKIQSQFSKKSTAGFEPIPVKKLDSKIIFTDGHTRAFTAYLNGAYQVPVIWDVDELDWEAYRICVKWCESEGVLTIADFRDRIISESEYDELWINRCREMHEDLKKQRNKLKKPENRT